MFLKELKKEMNKTKTWNGAEAFKSTRSKVLDLFAIAGNSQAMTDGQLETKIKEAFFENPELTIRVVFYLSDVRGGQGRRDVMRTALSFLTSRYPTQTKNLISLLAEYTRWDMLYEFVGTVLERDAFTVLYKETISAIREGRKSLVFKWLKSVNTSSEESVRLGKLTAKYFGLSEKEYRKMLSRYRKELGVVEVQMSADQWNSIDYSKLPSKAGLIYREAFKRHDAEGYDKYLNSVIKGEAKMNMSVAYPHEIISKYRNNDSEWHSKANPLDLNLEAAWKSLPNYFEGNTERILAVADASGSMFGYSYNNSTAQPIDLSIGLAIYCAERMRGQFHNYYMTFSDNPQLIQLNSRMTLKDKIEQIFRTDIGYSTNVDAVFDTLLKTAILNRTPQNEMPTTLLMISDMQFNSSYVKAPNYQVWKRNFEAAGYTLPQIVFWNVSAANNVPVEQDEKGTVLISGGNPVVLKYIYTGELLTPYEQMLAIINRERYEAPAEFFKGV